jgi:hypothetical protein
MVVKNGFALRDTEGGIADAWPGREPSQGGWSGHRPSVPAISFVDRSAAASKLVRRLRLGQQGAMRAVVTVFTAGNARNVEFQNG